MLLSYLSLSQKPRIFRQLTGLSLNEFDGIVEKSDKAIKQAFTHLGRPRKLASSQDKVLLLMIYYRTYVTHEFLGYFVELNNSNVSRLFKRLESIIAKKMAIKKDRTLTEDKVTSLLIDATEQSIQRPSKKKARKHYYSGKKKRHTHKVEIIIDNAGRITSVSKSRPGRDHDFRLRQESDPLPPDASKYVDLGYQGLDNICANVLLPHKRLPNKKLTTEQKQYNREHSQIRIPVEHKFAQLKKFRILGEVYRNFRRKHHLRFNVIAGIVNYQCGF